MYQQKKPPSEEQTFEKTPKKSKASLPKRKSKKEEEGVFTATENKIKEGSLRKSLRVDKDYKFSKSDLSTILKHEEGKSFNFQGKKFKMTDRLKKQITLALNMMSSTK